MPLKFVLGLVMILHLLLIGSVSFSYATTHVCRELLRLDSSVVARSGDVAIICDSTNTCRGMLRADSGDQISC